MKHPSLPDPDEALRLLPACPYCGGWFSLAKMEWQGRVRDLRITYVCGMELCTWHDGDDAGWVPTAACVHVFLNPERLPEFVVETGLDQ